MRIAHLPTAVAALAISGIALGAPLTLAERIAAHPPTPQLAPRQAPGEQVWIPSGKVKLDARIYKPKGAGPFPAMIWHHGSTQVPGWQPELAAFYNSKGFVFFIAHRHGHGKSEGEYIVDINNRLLAKYKDDEPRAWKEMIPLHDVYNADVVAEVDWLKAQSFVDRNRIVMSGNSYGGIQTILAAEKGLGVKGFLAFGPAAMSWKMIPLRERLLKAVANAKAPIFLLQAMNDYSTGPTEVLGPAIRKKGPPNQAKLYPAFGPDSNHQMGHASFSNWNIATEIWGPDVMAFIDAVLKNHR